MPNEYFTWVPTRNCRRFYKRTYQLNWEIDENLVNGLSAYGQLTRANFSQYSSQAKDTFKVTFEGALEIAGILYDTYLQLVVSKQEELLIEEVESTIIEWAKSKSRTSE